MQPTQTGIAVALALTVVFFAFNGMAFFKPIQPQTAAVEQSQLPTETTATNTTETTMTTENTPITKLQAIDEVVGTGAVAAAGDSVTVNYVGSLTNGTVFDASAKHGTSGFSFNLGAGQVIKGWDVGVAGMKEGGKRKLFIPADMAYGSQEVGGGLIPANSALIFEVELLKVQKGTR